MNRRIAGAAGAMLLAGLWGWASQAFAQGAMTPRMDVAPPPRVAPPPPPPVVPPTVAPTPPMVPMAPAMAPAAPNAPTPKAPTASAPVTPAPAAPIPSASQTPTRGTAGGPPPFTDSQTKALPGVSVGLRGPGGTRQVTSDSNGVVSLGPLRQGRYDLSIDQKNLGAGNGNQPVALGLLLPAVQSVREGARRFVTVVVTPVNDAPTLQIRVDVDAKGQVSSVNWGNGLGVNVAVGDFNGDGRADLKVFEDLAQRNPAGETRLAFAGLGPATPTAQNATINTSRSNIKHGITFTDGHAKLPNVGVTATGPGGVRQMRSDSQGVTRFDKLPIGNTIVEFNGGDIASTLKTTVGPNTPLPQKTLIELLVVIAIIAIKTDGTQVVFTTSLPANAVKTLKANLRVGRDSNLMDVDFGNGPQLPQTLTKTGTVTLADVDGLGTLRANTYTGATTVNQGVLKAIQNAASQGKPGDVMATNIVMDGAIR